MKKALMILIILMVALQFVAIYGNQRDEVIGIVYSLRGKVTLLKGGVEMLISPGRKLAGPWRIKLEKGSLVTILFKDGRKRTFWGPDVLSPEKISLPILKFSPFDKVLQKLSRFLENTSQNVEVLAGAIRGVTEPSGNFYLISPRCSALTYSSTVFYWKRVPSASSYKISIFENNEAPLFECVSTDTMCLVFPDSIGLLRGKKYYWKVEVIGNQPEMWDSSWFRILTYEEENSAQIQLRDASILDPLVKIMTLHDHHLYHDEFEMLREWVTFDPENSTYSLLLADLLGTKMGLQDFARFYVKRWSLSQR